MLNKQQTKKSAFKVNRELDRACRMLFGTTNASSCSKCGCDSLDELGIYPHDGSKHEWQILCLGMPQIMTKSITFIDNNLQKQIGGSNV